MRSFLRAKGIGLLELMLSLLIIATVIFLATRYYGTASQNLKVTQAVNMVNNVVDASYKWVEGQPNFNNVSINNLVLAGFLPQNYNDNFVNPWLGSIAVTPSQNDINKVTVTLTSVPQSSCIALQQKMQNSGQNVQCQPCDNNNICTFTGTF